MIITHSDTLKMVTIHTHTNNAHPNKSAEMPQTTSTLDHSHMTRETSPNIHI